MESTKNYFVQFFIGICFIIIGGGIGLVYNWFSSWQYELPKYQKQQRQLSKVYTMVFDNNLIEVEPVGNNNYNISARNIYNGDLSVMKIDNNKLNRMKKLTMAKNLQFLTKNQCPKISYVKTLSGDFNIINVEPILCQR